GDVEVRLHVLWHAGHRALQVGQHGAEIRDLVVLVDDVEAPDLAHGQPLARALDQVVVGAARHHHLNLVVPGQVVEHDARAHGVAHPLTDDAVKNAHGRRLYYDGHAMNPVLKKLLYKGQSPVLLLGAPPEASALAKAFGVPVHAKPAAGTKYGFVLGFARSA